MEKGTGQDPPRPAARLGYRAPPGVRVRPGRLVAVILLGLFWLALALLGAATLVVVSLITLNGGRSGTQSAQAVALWLVAVICLGPTAAAAMLLAVRYVVLEPVRMVRAGRTDDRARVGLGPA